MGRRILQRCVSLLRHPCLGVKQGPHRTSPPPDPRGLQQPPGRAGGGAGWAHVPTLLRGSAASRQPPLSGDPGARVTSPHAEGC